MIQMMDKSILSLINGLYVSNGGTYSFILIN